MLSTEFPVGEHVAHTDYVLTQGRKIICVVLTRISHYRDENGNGPESFLTHSADAKQAACKFSHSRALSLLEGISFHQHRDTVVLKNVVRTFTDLGRVPFLTRLWATKNLSKVGT